MAAWYVVVVGRRVGVFDTWLEAAALVDNLSQARHAKFKSRDAAYAAYEAAKARGEVKIVDANPSISGDIHNPAMTEDPSPLNGSPSQVRVSPTNGISSDVPNELRQCHTLTASPKPESSALVSGDQTTIEQRPQVAEMSRTSNEEQLPEQSDSGTAGTQQPSFKVSASQNYRIAGVRTVEFHSPSTKGKSISREDQDVVRDSGRPRSSRIQRNVDSDVSEPESLVSVEIIDNRRVSGKFKIPAVVPPLQSISGTKTAGIGPNRRNRVIEPVPHYYTSSLEFQVHSRSSTTASTSSSRRAFVSMESDANGYPSGTDSSGPEDVTPRGSQTSRRDKGKAKQSPLVLISSDDESSANDYDIDPSVSEIATPSQKSVKNSEVSSLKSRITTSSNHIYRRQGLMEDIHIVPHSYMLEALGLSQPAHIPIQVYEPGSDPRSPIRKMVFVPEHDSSPTFGRPSPRPARPLTLSGFKFTKI
ncbi:hypothetical protein E1B28_000509 [Marasmius oreades]|uniref:Ribonuclease H1 N-terminal domain-containing protein n=1 Tax=Marasmius oreades TaxID=181124 RepID=A0A9P8AEJ6_9AGAR|nr:uncharacterized protein E1B28_000509 [Marasmius oreades]KAG7098578.1 hypothetical protein E1B28_000509 [Marasmius oreades]